MENRVFCNLSHVIDPQKKGGSYRVDGYEGLWHWVADVKDEVQAFILENEKGERLVVRYGLFWEGKFYRLCHEYLCGSKQFPCKNKPQDIRCMCRYHFPDGQPAPKELDVHYYAFKF